MIIKQFWTGYAEYSPRTLTSLARYTMGATLSQKQNVSILTCW